MRSYQVWMLSVFLSIFVVIILTSVIAGFRKWLVKWFPKLFASMLVLGMLLLVTGCAGLSDPAKPRTAAEEFPARNQNPRIGLVVNSGTAPMNLFVYDQANRLVEQVYLSGADRHGVSASGQPYPQYWVRLLDPGCYRVESWPFFHAVRWVPPRMVRVDLPRQTYGVCVGVNPSAYYYGGQHWAWLLQIGTNIPDGATGLPLIQILNPLGR